MCRFCHLSKSSTSDALHNLSKLAQSEQAACTSDPRTDHRRWLRARAVRILVGNVILQGFWGPFSGQGWTLRGAITAFSLCQASASKYIRAVCKSVIVEVLIAWRAKKALVLFVRLTS